VGQLNQLTPSWYSRHFSSDSGQVVCLLQLRSTQPFILNWWINRVPASNNRGKGGSAAFARWQVTLCDPIWHAGSRSGAGASSVNCYTALSYLYLTHTERKKYQCTHTHTHTHRPVSQLSSGITGRSHSTRDCMSVQASCVGDGRTSSRKTSFYRITRRHTT